MIELSNAAYDKLYAAACHDLGMPLTLARTIWKRALAGMQT
jgi:hypothetical protein